MTAATPTDAEIDVVRDLLARCAGLVFDDSRRAALAWVVSEQAADSGAGSVAAWLATLEHPAGAVRLDRLLDAVTIHETQFFRNPPQMELLRRLIVPGLVAQARGGRPVTVWSAGTSTGEEAYTLAILLLDAAGAGGLPPGVRVVGTDISARALETARTGVYSGRSIDLVDAATRSRWLTLRPEGKVEVAEAVRALVELVPHNLVAEPPPFGPGEVDLLVCRNVTIYFGRDTTAALVARFHEVLADGGHLLLGHSETLWRVSEAFTLVSSGAAFAYRKDRVVRPPRRLGARRLPGLGRRGPARDDTADRAVPGTLLRLRAAPPPAETPDPAVLLPPTGRLAAARAALAAGRYLEAAELAGRAALSEPLDAAAHALQGQALITLGQDRAALAPLRKAAYLDPRAGNVHFLLAGALSRLGDHPAAATAYRAAAGTLAHVPEAALAGLLDGCAVDELVELCHRLAARAGAGVQDGRR